MTDRTVDKTDNLPPPLVTLDQLKRDFPHLETELAALEAREYPPVLEDEDDLAGVTKLINDFNEFWKKVETIREQQQRPLLDGQRTNQAFFKTGIQDRAKARVAILDPIGSAYLKKKADRERQAREAAAKAAQDAAEKAQREAEEARAKVAATQGAMDTINAVRADATADALTAFANKATVAAESRPTATRTAGGSAGLGSEWTFDGLELDKVDLEALRPFIDQDAIEKALRAFIKSGRRDIRGARIFEQDKARWRK